MKIIRIGVVVFIVLIFSACGSGPRKSKILTPFYKIFPFKIPLYGNVRVSVAVDNFNITDDTRIMICDHLLYDVKITESGFTGMVPGCPYEGWQDMIIEGNGKKIILRKALEFFSPFPQFRSFTAIGASYTAGFINLGLEEEDQLYSPFAQVARQSGAYFPQPLVKKGFFTAITIEDLRRNGCSPSDLARSYVVNLVKSLKKMKDGKGFFLANARVDPYLSVFNLGIGAARISDSIYGAAKSNNALIGIFEHLVYSPFVDLLESFSDPSEGSPFEVASKRNSEYILTVDLFADDILYWHFAQLFNIPLSPGITSVKSFKKTLRDFFDETEREGKKVFIADLPDITQLPAIEVLGSYLKHIGFGDEEVDSLYRNLKEDVRKYNEIFYSLSSKYSHVYPVPFSDTVNRYASGITINGELYKFSYLGGLISLDGIHPTRTGYALIANMFIKEINTKLNIEIPLINLESVAGSDPLRPEELSKRVDIERCRQEFYSVE